MPKIVFFRFILKMYGRHRSLSVPLNVCNQKFIYLLARFVGSKCIFVWVIAGVQPVHSTHTHHKTKGKINIRVFVRERSANNAWQKRMFSSCVYLSLCVCVFVSSRDSHRIRLSMKINRYYFATHDVSGNSIQCLFVH